MRCSRRTDAVAVLLLATALLLSAATPGHAANRAPVCDPLPVNVAPGTQRALHIQCYDPDRSPITREFGRPDRGTLTRPVNGLVRYTAPITPGADRVTMAVSDGEARVTFTQEIEVTNATSPPSCRASELRAVGGRGTVPFPVCWDPDEGDIVRHEVVTAPEHGRADGATWWTERGFRGADSYTVRAYDGTTWSQPATVTVDSVDLERPTCEPRAEIPVRSGTTKVIALVCTDNTGGTLNLSSDVEIGMAPAHGKVLTDYWGLRYEAREGYHGTDAATVRVRNSAGVSDPIALRFRVAPDANEPPECDPGWHRVVRAGSAFHTIAPCRDADGDPLVVAQVVAPAQGTLSGLPGPTLHYTAKPNGRGADMITLDVSDGRAPAVRATQGVEVVGPGDNTSPGCAPADVSTPRNRVLSSWVFCGDPDGDQVEVRTTDAPDHGTVELTQDPPYGATFRYTPQTGYVGPDAFTVVADDDGDGPSASRPVTVHVTVREPVMPTCEPSPAVGVRPGSDELVQLRCWSPDDMGEPVVTVVDGPDHGTLSEWRTATWLYTPTGAGAPDPRPGAPAPAPAYEGPDRFTVRVASHDRTQSFELVQELVVDPDFNTRPRCSAADRTTRAGRPVTLELNCLDGEGDDVAVSVDGEGPAHGALVEDDAAAGRWTYTPATDFAGTETIRFVASDGRDESEPFAVKVVVRSLEGNEAPTCYPGGWWIDPVAGGMVSPHCVDPEGDPITVTFRTPPAHGTATYDTAWQSWRYQPDEGYLGSDRFTFVAADDAGLTTREYAMSLTVGEVRNPPACRDDAVAVAHDAPREILVSCTFSSADEPRSFEVVTPPAHGGLGPFSPTGRVVYTPATGYAGADRFVVRARHGQQTSDPVTVQLSVSPRPGETTVPEPEPEPDADPGPPVAERAPAPRTDRLDEPSVTTRTTTTAVDLRRAAARLLGAPATSPSGLDLGAAAGFVPVGGGTVTDAGTARVLAVSCPEASCEVTAEPELLLGTAPTSGPRGGGARLGTQRLKVAPGATRVVSVRLSKAQRARVRRVRTARLRIKVAVKDAGGRSKRDTVVVRLRTARRR